MQEYIKGITVFNNMVQRCYDEGHKAYKNYGGRGIIISDEWLKNINGFIDWYVKNYFDKCQVDRIDNDGPYGPENCRMVTSKENNRNRRNTRFLTAWDETKTYGEWAEDVRAGKGVNFDVIASRHKKGKLAPEQIVSFEVLEIRGQQFYTPKYSIYGETKTLLEWSTDKRCMVGYKTLYSRVVRQKWGLEKALTQPAGRNYSGRFTK
jgi:hypothetical protein